MARIAGVDLPRQKRVNIGLTYIYGIGNPRSARILDQANVDPMKKVQDLSEDEVNRIRQVIEGARIPMRARVKDHARAPWRRRRNRWRKLKTVVRYWSLVIGKGQLAIGGNNRERTTGN
jgi:ribosomal protein S13